MRKIALKFNEKKLILVLRNTPTADKIYNALPFSSKVQKWGEEIFFNTHLDIDQQFQYVVKILNDRFKIS